ncbi:zinc dependent phospholipase C family protein [Hellea balneolensis]|uniref:zinc dependent phospholipase C family protein n=1 Tax=Hellea balneolensis TaxID=287478 RepID=UPI00047A4640|nr:zinc dependent phospholipase C family protein [Hellea balneolensis]
MNSPTHTLLALALLSKTGDRKRNWAVFAGSIIPDAVIYIWAPYQSLVNGVSGETLWRELYFAEPMQNLIAYFNSIPIYLSLALLGFIMRTKTWGKVILFFALAALTHMATDLPVHNHDAYRHFWPLSDWRFISPFSYYEREHHAGWVSLIEIFIALTSIFILWKRFPKLWVKIILGLLAAFYIALPIILRLMSLSIES